MYYAHSYTALQRAGRKNGKDREHKVAPRLDERKVESIDELAQKVGKECASHTLQLTLLSPEIIHMALTGTLPPSVNMKSLKAALPPEWENQREFLGVG